VNKLFELVKQLMMVNYTFSRNNVAGSKSPNNSKRLSGLLNETETYAYTAECPTGGCMCVTEDTTSLKQCMGAMNSIGSSNDFTYKLWDVLRGTYLTFYVLSYILNL
jgi:hypothetical protein